MDENNELWRMKAFYVGTPSEIMEQDNINMKQLADLLSMQESNLRKKLDPNNNILLKSLSQIYSALNRTLLVFPLSNDCFDLDELKCRSTRYGDFRSIHPHDLSMVLCDHVLKDLSNHILNENMSAAFILAMLPAIQSALDSGLHSIVDEAVREFVNKLTSAIMELNHNGAQRDKEYG